MRCPSCDADLRPAVYEGMMIQTCESCGGEFVGADELIHIVRTREELFSEEWRDVVANREPTFGVPDSEMERQLACPACEGAMQTLNFAGDTSVFVDKCGACGGVWLDHDEIEKIQVILERWQDEAPEQIQSILGELEQTRRDAAERTSNAFAGSRFSFVNALINRLLDAA